MPSPGLCLPVLEAKSRVSLPPPREQAVNVMVTIGLAVAKKLRIIEGTVMLRVPPCWRCFGPVVEKSCFRIGQSLKKREPQFDKKAMLS